MNCSDFDFSLPKHLIAQLPLASRADSRLLVYSKDKQSIEHSQFSSLLDYLKPGDLLVMNDTKVMAARLFGHKETGGKLELLIERVLSATQFVAHIKASKAPKVGSFIQLDEEITLKVIERQGRLFVCELLNELSIESLLESQGHMPLPPYIERVDDANDASRYQTVYAAQMGAVAAPTAGLHFDESMLSALKTRGIDHAFLTLHVGSGTFQPVQVDSVQEHIMHSEWANVSSDLVQRIVATKARGGRVIAVGTTVVRSLETAALEGEFKPYQGETDIFIYPGFEFKVVDGMLTNFHLPKSTLIMLVAAFIGHAEVMKVYQQAVEHGYRFFSYGDANLYL